MLFILKISNVHFTHSFLSLIDIRNLHYFLSFYKNDYLDLAILIGLFLMANMNKFLQISLFKEIVS